MGIVSRALIRKAIARYARRHGYFVRTVRDVSSLRSAAIAEYVRDDAGRR